MPWFRVDDGFYGHPKVQLISNDAVALWVFAGSWSMRYLTDGHIPFQSLVMVRGTKQTAQELLDAGLWDMTPDGYLFRDWSNYQATKEELEISRAQSRERTRRYRSKKQDVDTHDSPDVADDVTQDVTRDSHVCTGMEWNGKELDLDLDLKSNDINRFDEFWDAYPAKLGSKAKTQDNFRKALKKAPADVIIEAARRYAVWLANHPDPPKTKYAQGWLTEERWNEQLTPYPIKRDSWEDLYRRAGSREIGQ
jgi:hypothetical protein